MYADLSGYVTAMDTRELGMAVVSMGGGRRCASDLIDYRVGLTDIIRLGASVDPQTPLAYVHVNDEQTFAEAERAVRAAISITDEKPQETPDVYACIRADDVK